MSLTAAENQNFLGECGHTLSACECPSFKKRKHKWKANPIIKNWDKCECGAERHKGKDGTTYRADSATYCVNIY
jgi:hypothetical protein